VKVTSVEGHVVAVQPGINWVLLQVMTNEGLEGWGECTLEGKDLSVLAAVEELTRSLLGEDPASIELHWNRWYRTAAWKGAALFSAMSGLEQALWDIRGKQLGEPVHALFGGRVRDAVNAYTWAGASQDPAELADGTSQAADQYGYELFKLDPFDSHFTLSRGEVSAARDRVAAVAEAVPAGRVAIEGHGRFHVPAAREAIAALEDFAPLFFEEMVSADDLDSARELRRSTAAPLAAGERGFTRWGIWPLLSERLVDYVQPDLCHAGGLLEVRKIAAMAETVGIAVIPHNPNGPAGFAATLQVAASAPNLIAIETVHQRFELLNELMITPFDIRDGKVAIPQKPGLGIEINLDAVRSRRGDPNDFPFPDGSVIPLGRL
jgi:galactonate dehydratase